MKVHFFHLMPYRFLPDDFAENFRTQIQDSQVVIMRECAHMPMLEKREEFVSLVSDFLSNGS